MTLTLREAQMGSQSWELVVVDDEFSTLASTLTSTTLRTAATSASITATATTTSTASTATSALDEFIVVFASLEAEQVVVRGLGLGVNDVTSNVGVNRRDKLLLGLNSLNLLLGVKLFVFSLLSSSKVVALGCLLVEVILKGESFLFLAFDLLRDRLFDAFASFSAGALLFGLFLSVLALSLIFNESSISAHVEFAVAALLHILLSGTGSRFAVIWMSVFASFAEVSVLLIARTVTTVLLVVSAFSALSSSLLSNLVIHVVTSAGSWAVATLLATSATASSTTASGTTAFAITAWSVGTAFAIATAWSVTSAATATATALLLPLVGGRLEISLFLAGSKPLLWLSSLRLLDHNLLSLLCWSLLFLRGCSRSFVCFCKCCESIHLNATKLIIISIDAPN